MYEPYDPAEVPSPNCRWTLFAVLALVVIAVAGSLLVHSCGRQPAPPRAEGEQQASYRKSVEFAVATGVFQKVDFNRSVLWVDDVFLAKPRQHQINAIRPMYLHLLGRGDSEWTASVEIRHSDTDEALGKYSGGTLKLAPRR